MFQKIFFLAITITTAMVARGPQLTPLARKQSLQPITLSQQ